MASFLDRLRLRSETLAAVRRFFNRHDFIEVETPVRVVTPALELHIDAEPAGEWFLRTSPELHLKRLLAAGATRIFEVGPCFRRGEMGPRHHPEYSMLEWYRTETDYDGVLEDTCGLLQAVARDVLGESGFTWQGRRIDLSAPWLAMTVSEAFLSHAGWDPVVNFDADRFDLDLVNKVEPALPVDRPVVLRDYPAPLSALARLKPGNRDLAERWELYIGGMELANAYSELTDATEQRQRFVDCARERERLDKARYALDEPFLQALTEGLPACGGVALGIDRLVMLLSDAHDISEVRVCAEGR